MNIKNILSLSAAVVLLASCGDKMDYKEYSVYDEDFVKTTFGRSAGLVTSVYNDLDYDFGNYSGAMLSSATDESVYSHSGNAIEKFYDGGSGCKPGGRRKDCSGGLRWPLPWRPVRASPEAGR